MKIDIIIENENIKEQLDSNALFVANHGSLLDSMFTYYAVGGKLAYFAAGDKRNMDDFPEIKKITDLADIVFVDRSNLRGGIKSIKQGTQVLEKGKNLFIFPEGEINDHLDKNGNVIAEFAPGSFRTAVNAHKPIVPIAIEGANAIHNSININGPITSGKVKLTFLEPITDHLESDISVIDIAQKVEQEIIKTLTKE